MATDVHRVLQWNTQGISTAKEDILKLIETFTPTVLSFQEIFLANDFHFKLKGYHALAKQGTFNRRYHGGVIVYIPESCPYQEIAIQSIYQIVAAKVTIGHKTITVASLYIPGSVEIDKEELGRVINSLPKPCLVLGDFNAYNQMWGGHSTTRRGKEVEDIVSRNSLNILNTGQPTHESGSAIDLTVVSPETTPDCKRDVYPSVLSSDHYPIIITIEMPANHQPQIVSNYNYKKADRNAYSSDMIWNGELQQRGRRVEEMVDEMYRRLYIQPRITASLNLLQRSTIQSLGGAVSVQTFGRREKRNTGNGSRERKETGNGSRKDKISWKRARAIATKMFKQAKRQNMQQYLETMKYNTPPSQIYEKLRKIRGRPPRRINILRKNGIIISNKQ